MSEFDNEIENENETKIDDTTEGVTEESEAVVAEETAEAGAKAPEDKKEKEQDPNDVLFEKANKAARLLRARRAVLRKQQEDNEGKSSVLVRALKLLEIKPKMEQKEIAELLGVRLRELDAVMAEAEKDDIVARVEPAEPDMRKVVIMADDDAVARAEAKEAKGEDLVPGLSAEDVDQLNTLLDKVIDPLVALGLDEDRDSFHGGRGGHDDRRGGREGRGDRGGFRGGRDGDRRDGDRRGGFGGGRGGSRGGDRNDRGSRSGRDDRNGSRGGYRGGSRDERGGFRGGRDDRGGSRGFGSSSRGGDRGGFRGGRDDRNGSRGGYRGGSSRY